MMLKGLLIGVISAGWRELVSEEHVYPTNSVRELFLVPPLETFHLQVRYCITNVINHYEDVASP